jgi:hypothetical protein
MTPYAAEFRRCLETLDIAGVRTLWHRIAPHLPPPVSDRDCLIAVHHARTQANSIALKLRAYSHRWLLDHGMPSGLPDELKPTAERMYPRIVDGVGVAVRASTDYLRPVARAIQGAMTDAVMEAYADNKRDPVFVKQRMKEARERQQKYFRDIFEQAAKRNAPS